MSFVSFCFLYSCVLWLLAPTCTCFLLFSFLLVSPVGISTTTHAHSPFTHFALFPSVVSFSPSLVFLVILRPCFFIFFSSHMSHMVELVWPVFSEVSPLIFIYLLCFSSSPPCLHFCHSYLCLLLYCYLCLSNFNSSNKFYTLLIPPRSENSTLIKCTFNNYASGNFMVLSCLPGCMSPLYFSASVTKHHSVSTTS